MPLPATHERVATDVVDGARAATSAVITGLPGSGRTGVLQRVGELLGDDGFRVLRVRGARALRGHPLEALAVSALGADRPARGPSLLATYVTALERRAESSRLVLLVDDADELDEESVGALVAAWGRTPFPVVAASRPSLHTPAGSSLIETITPVDLVEMPPLSYEDSAALAEAVAGGPLTAETAGRLHAKAGGMPGLVAGIVRTALRAGRLVQVDGVWRARGELWVPALSATVERLTAGLEGEALHAVQVLALAGPVTTTVARRLVPWEVLESLDDHGLLRTLRQSGRDHVALYPPLISEQLQHEGRSTLRLRVTQEISRALSGDVGSVVEPQGRGQPAAEARQVRTALEVSTSQGRENATLRNRLLAEHVQRQRAVRGAEWEHDRTAATAVPYLEVLLVQGSKGAAEVVAATAETGDPTAVGLLRAAEAVRRTVEDGDVAAAHRAMTAPLSAAMAREPGLTAFLGALDRRVALLSEGITDVSDLTDANDPADAADEPAPRPVDGKPCSVAALAVEVEGVLRAERLIAAGNATDALAVLADTLDTGLWDRPRHAAAGLATVLAGRPAEALAEADRRLDEALDDLDLDGVWVHGYTRALALGTLGRFAELRDHVGAVMSVGVIPLRQAPYAVGNLAIGAYAALQQGAADSALLLARQAQDVTTLPGPWPMMSVGWVEPVVAARRAGDPEAEAAALWAEADMLAARGCCAAAGVAGILALSSVPDTGRAEKVVRGLPVGQGDGIDDMVALARASTADTPGPALALYRDALARGAVLVAGRALGHAIRLSKVTGDVEAADRLLVEAVGELPPEMLATLTPAVDLSVLTLRELDVTRLVEAGLSNQQVGRRLGITVSTVENHLNRIYRKLAVDGRHELVSLLHEHPAA